MGRNTLTRVEWGDPGVALGIYAIVLFVLGLWDRLATLADRLRPGAEPAAGAPSRPTISTACFEQRISSAPGLEPEQRSSALAGSRHREAVRSRPRFARRSPGETAAQDEEVRPAVQTGRVRLQRSPQTATKGYKILHIEICRRRSDVTDEARRAPTRSNRRLRARAS